MRNPIVTTLLASAAVLSTSFAHRHAIAQRKALAHVAIIDLTQGADHALLVGGWNDKRWVADKGFHTAVHGGETYRFYGLTDSAGTATGGKARLSEASGSAWQIEVKQPPASKESLIGLTGNGNAMPRKPQVVTDLAQYRSAVAQILMRHGLSAAAANVTGAIRVDLDGDGTPEEMISATCARLAHDSGEAIAKPQEGDYSFTLLRMRSAGKVVTSVLGGDYWYRPNATSIVNEIGGALDLNGDGKLEIVVRWHYFEGGGVRVYTVENGRPRVVLNASDGA